MVLHVNNPSKHFLVTNHLLQGLLTQSRVSVQSGASAAVITQNQQSHINEFISQTEPFLCFKATYR